MSTNKTPSQPTAAPWSASFVRFDGRYPEINGTPYLEIKAGCGYAGGSEKSGFNFSAYLTPANAALIVAAPDLFRTLKAMVEAVGDESAMIDASFDAVLALTKAKNFPSRPADDDGEPQSSYCSSEKPEPDGDLDETDIYDAYAERKMEQADRLHDELKDRQWEGGSL